MEPDSYILAKVPLTIGGNVHVFYLVAQIIESWPAPNDSERYIHRSQFIFKELKDREMIVRYVFEEERRMRKRDNG